MLTCWNIVTHSHLALDAIDRECLNVHLLGTHTQLETLRHRSSVLSSAAEELQEQVQLAASTAMQLLGLGSAFQGTASGSLLAVTSSSPIQSPGSQQDRDTDTSSPLLQLRLTAATSIPASPETAVHQLNQRLDAMQQTLGPLLQKLDDAVSKRISSVASWVDAVQALDANLSGATLTRTAAEGMQARDLAMEHTEAVGPTCVRRFIADDRQPPVLLMFCRPQHPAAGNFGPTPAGPAARCNPHSLARI